MVKEEAKVTENRCTCTHDHHHHHHHHHHQSGEPEFAQGPPGSDAGSTNGVTLQGKGSSKVMEKQDYSIEHHRSESPGPISTPERAHLPGRILTDGVPGPREHSPSPQRGRQVRRAFTTTDVGNRRKVAETFTKIGVYLGTPGADWGNSDFKSGKALDFPEIPGEENRNEKLQEIRERYNRPIEGQIPRSRAGSMNSRAPSIIDVDSPTARASSPFRRSFTDAHAGDSITFDLPVHGSTPSTGQVGAKPHRRSTLEVPSEVYGSLRNKAPGSPTSPSSPVSPSTPTRVTPEARSSPPIGASPVDETPRVGSIPSIKLPT